MWERAMVAIGWCASAKHCPFLLLSPPSTFFLPQKKLTSKAVSNRRRTLTTKLVAKLGGEPVEPCLPKHGVHRASLRLHESNRPDPLFIDPYAGCFLPAADEHHAGPAPMEDTTSTAACPYLLATSYLDNKLLDAMSRNDELRQIVLLTDGMDTRPYRLRWQRLTLIFDISPEGVFKVASQKLQGIGAKLAKTCILHHVPLEASGLQESICQKGFSGSRPSIWVLQGLPLLTAANFEEILSVVSSLAMKGSIFMGELPGSLVETESRNQITIPKWMDKIFMSHGFRVEVIDYSNIADEMQHSTPSGGHVSVLFVAYQLQLSDEQMEKWRMEFQRIEEEGDEEGFEDMLV